MAKISDFQSEDAGSTPVIRSIFIERKCSCEFESSLKGENEQNLQWLGF